MRRNNPNDLIANSLWETVGIDSGTATATKTAVATRQMVKTDPNSFEFPI